MVYVEALVGSQPNGRVPLVLIHGAASSAPVWTFWQRELAARGWSSHAVDLRGHGQNQATTLTRTTMADYASDVISFAEQLAHRPTIVGWSMGGLVAMMAAAKGAASACVCLAPSTPALEVDGSVALRSGTFGPEEYGIFDRDSKEQPTMPDLDADERSIALAALGKESRFARDERRAGIVIESLPCPLLVVTGTDDDQWPQERYADLWLQADQLSVEGASHWGLVLSRRALTKTIPAVLEWLAGTA